MLDDREITAGLAEDTQRMLLAEGSSGGLIEYLHFDPLDIVAHPLVENGAEKIAQTFSRHSAGANATLLIWFGLDQGQKNQVWGFDALEEPVKLGGIFNIL